MSKIVQLTIFGEPQPKQRPRVSMANGFARTYTPEKTVNYESLVRHEYTCKYGGLSFEKEEPIEAIIKVYFALSSSDYGKKGLNKSGREKMSMVYCTKHKDLDNIIKCVLDALNSVCYPDDKQIVSINSCKCWTTESPRVEITLMKQGE